MKLCCIDGCTHASDSHGMCKTHVSRWRKYGDATVTSPRYTPKGVPTTWIEEHRHFAGDSCLIWPFGRTKKGYGTVKVDRRTVSVHRIMCEALNGPAPQPEMQAAHSCGRGFDGCVNPRHLRWATVSENLDDKISHGTALARLAPGSDPAIGDMRRRGLSTREIGRAFGVSKGSIEKALRRIERAG